MSCEPFFYALLRFRAISELEIPNPILIHVEALIIRTGFGGPVYYTYSKEPPGFIGNYLGP